MKFSFHAKLVLIVGIIVSTALLATPALMPLTGEAGPDTVTAIGRFHILVLHFPICLLLIVPLVELLGCIRPMHYFKDAVPSVLWLAIIFAVAACTLGFMLATGEGDAGSLVDSHMWGGILTTILMFVALFLFELNPDRKNKPLYAAYLLVLFASAGTLTVGSHHGASLVHGEEYLYEKAPEFVKAMIGVEEEPVEILTYDSPVYASLIEPVFEANCYTCHSELKQKGQFRMDSMEHVFKGGASQLAGVVPGDVEHSEVVTRMLLPMADKKVMPPKEQDPLTADQIALIQWWVAGGASETQSIEELSFQDFPDEIERIVAGLIDSSDDEVAPLEMAVFQEIAGSVKKKFGLDIILNSQNPEEGVHVIAQNAPDQVPAGALVSLDPISGHVTSLDLWRRELDAGSLASLAGFNRLTHLRLAQTNISTDDLPSLASLKKLKSLNLFGTSLGDEAVESLSQIRSLRKLHLYECGFSPDGIAALQAALPRCEILHELKLPEFPKAEAEEEPAAENAKT